MFFIKRVIRTTGFISKEVREIMRQPRLILSLLFGPFLILLLFGIGYTGIIPQLTAILVLPNEPRFTSQRDTLASQFSKGVDLIDVTVDLESAKRRLRDGTVDVVIALPANADEQIGSGAQAIIPVYYSEVDPLGESRVVLGTLNYTNELNKATVAEAFRRGQGRAEDIRQALGRIEAALGRISERMEQGETDQAAEDAAQVRNETDAILLGAGLMLQILRSAPLAGAEPTTTTQGQNLARTEDSIRRLNEDVAALQAELESPEPDRERVRTRVEAVRADVRDMQGLTTQFESINPYVLVAPFFGQTDNLAGKTSFVNFYTPGAIALLLQHIAITLGALSMVRERMRGSLELFRVSPITPGEILVGKYLGFLIFLAVLTVLLLGLIIFGLGVPLRGDYGWLALTLLLLIFASLGLGFAISMVSSTESQAVQLAMLTLLLSVFFGGFFLPIESFWAPVQAVSYALPVTHGITSLQDVMLRGREPHAFYPLMLLALGLLFGLFAMWRFLREFRRG